ncbi:MAG: hypothetical protein M1457_14495, partial [bacterium]|nr:hypothetical protein [bacterium]
MNENTCASAQETTFNGASETEDPIPRKQFRRHWLVVTIAGLLGMTYFNITGGGAPRIKFLTELSATAFDFGIMAGASSLAIIFQIVSGILNNLIPRRKPVWIGLYVAHRLLFVAVLAAPVFFLGERTRIWWIIVVLFLHDALMHLGQPLWLAWMTDLMPRDSFNRQWAWRQWIITAASIFVSIFVALLFNRFEVQHQVVLGFIILGGFGVLIGVTDILCFITVPEPLGERVARPNFKQMMGQPLHDRQSRPYL